MGQSSDVGFFAFALFLVVCVSARAADNSEGGEARVVTIERAKKGVLEAKENIKEASDKAQSTISIATVLLERVELFKTQAEESHTKAGKVAPDNNDATYSVNKIKTTFNEVSELHQSAKGKLEQTISSLGEFLKEAETLKGECETELSLFKKDAEEYRDTNNKVSYLKNQAGVLKNKISDVLTVIDGVKSTADNMDKKLKDAQLANLHISVIVAVAKIETLVKNADSIIENTQNKKNEVNKIVQEMKKHCTTELTKANAIIKEHCQRANNELAKATDALGKAQQAVATMKQQKLIADSALTNVQAAKLVDNAQEEVTKAEKCVGKVNQIFQQLQSALETAETSVTNTKDSQQKIETALSTITPATRPEQSVTNPQVKTLQESVSAAVSKIKAMMEEADSTLRKTENHKTKVNEIVQEMKTLKTRATTDAIDHINKLCKSAEGELAKVTSAVEKVKAEKEAMKQQKRIADAALTEVNAVTDIDKTQQQVDKATSCVVTVKENLAQIRSALQTAENYVEKTDDLKQKLKEALSTTTTAPSTEGNTETEKPDPPVVVGTQPHQKDATIQPTSKDSLAQSDNSSEEIKDALIKGAQNVPTTSLTGGKAPAPGANNDSAMTVSVPLLVALIASAVLQ